MNAGRIVLIAAMVLSLPACKQDAEVTATGSNADNASDAVADSPVGAEAPGPSATSIGRSPRANGAVVDGRLADDPGFQMPVPGASTPGQLQAASMRVQGDDVRLALLEGMQASGADIRVQVSPRGVVSLSGAVATVADRQRAHYLARALPGVAEVDIRNLGVRPR